MTTIERLCALGVKYALKKLLTLAPPDSQDERQERDAIYHGLTKALDEKPGEVVIAMIAGEPVKAIAVGVEPLRVVYALTPPNAPTVRPGTTSGVPSAGV